MAAEPMVSCIMPTKDRPELARFAISWFLRQSYCNKELIVLDNGECSIQELVEGHSGIQYFRIDCGNSLGELRNLACEQARGQIIVHWDDDDWMSANRLQVQVGRLQSTGADITGIQELCYWDIVANRAWKYCYKGEHKDRWVLGGSLCYTKKSWQKNPFPHLKNGEDTAFLLANHSAKVSVVRNSRIYVGIMHGRNTATQTSFSQCWTPLSRQGIKQRMGPDFKSYLGLRSTIKREAAVRQSEPSLSMPLSSPSHVPTKYLATPYAKEGPSKAEAEQNCQNSSANLSKFIEPLTSSQEHVLVTIPYYQAANYIRRSVKSILEQSHQNLTLVVINDACKTNPRLALRDIEDPRLFIFDLPTNRGRYYADMVALSASTAEYYLVQDADDWSETHRIETLLRALGAEPKATAVLSSTIEHLREMPQGFMQYEEVKALTRDFAHRARHIGLFRSDVLRAVGGFYGGYRFAWDSLMMNFVMMLGPILEVEEPLYHVHHRSNSLTHDNKTGVGSVARQRVVSELSKLYMEAWHAYTLHKRGQLSLCEFKSRLNKLTNRHVTQKQAVDLERDSERLAQFLTRL